VSLSLRPSLKPPLSKSDAQRALVLAEALGVPLETVVPADEELPRDVRVLQKGLEQLREQKADIDCHDGGAPFRFLLTQAALTELPEARNRRSRYACWATGRDRLARSAQGQ